MRLSYAPSPLRDGKEKEVLPSLLWMKTSPLGSRDLKWELFGKANSHSKGILASIESPLKRAAFPEVNDLCLQEGVEGLRQTKRETEEKWYQQQWGANSPGVTNLPFAHLSHEGG